MQLVARNTLLAASDEIHRLQPDTHRNLAVFKDGADLHGEGLAALVALPKASSGSLAFQLADALHTATARADGSLRPKARFNVSVSRFFIVKMRAGKVRHWVCSDYGFTLRSHGGYVKYNNAKLKDWRRIHTRYDRCAHTFMSAICIAATVIFWLDQ